MKTEETIPNQKDIEKSVEAMPAVKLPICKQLKVEHKKLTIVLHSLSRLRACRLLCFADNRAMLNGHCVPCARPATILMPRNGSLHE